MMLLIVLVLLLCSAVTEAFWDMTFDKETLSKSTGGGVGCAACVISLGLLEQMAVYDGGDTQKVLDKICHFFPSGPREACEHYVSKYGSIVVRLIDAGQPPDSICHEIKFCTLKTCRLFPEGWSPGGTSRKRATTFQKTLLVEASKLLEKLEHDKTSVGNPWSWLEKIFSRVAKHKPVFDADGDLYSPFSRLRGSSWRGADCEDFDKTIHAGRRQSSHDADIDFNCNGIAGTDSADGKAWEDKLCGDSGQLGVVVLGDSASAHFHIPPRYVTAKEINGTTYSNLLDVLANEFDWPEYSAMTAYYNTSFEGPVYSVYEQMTKRNRCNHRDYQNIAVNGARSGAMNSTIVHTMARSHDDDQPALVVLSLIGNDVCNPHHFLSHMTTVDEFRANTLGTLKTLDKMLPKGSHVLTTGLADGRVLWDNLHNRTHPIGVEYERVYDFLNCLTISPCWVWMNSNETIRNAGSQRARELSKVYPEIIKKHKFENFDIGYVDWSEMFLTVLKKWTDQGGKVWQLIEPVDGFHPNQMANYLIGQQMWTILKTQFPHFIGDVNPNNDKILSMFGDQGGYGL